MNPVTRPLLRPRSRGAIALSGLLILAACASAPLAPTEALQAAEMAVANAEQARVGEFAALELSEAREKLAAARSAVAREDMVTAAYLADESRASAEFASAKADAAKARQINQEFRQSTEVLRQEMQRRETRGTRSNTGGTQP